VLPLEPFGPRGAVPIPTPPAPPVPPLPALIVLPELVLAVEMVKTP